MGTFVNNETTSNDTNSVLWDGDCLRKGNKLRTTSNKRAGITYSGDSTHARYLERAYIGDDTNETMGLRGIPGL